GIRDLIVTGVQTCALPIWPAAAGPPRRKSRRASAAPPPACATPPHRPAPPPVRRPAPPRPHASPALPERPPRVQADPPPPPATRRRDRASADEPAFPPWSVVPCLLLRTRQLTRAWRRQKAWKLRAPFRRRVPSARGGAVLRLLANGSASPSHHDASTVSDPRPGQRSSRLGVRAPQHTTRPPGQAHGYRLPAIQRGVAADRSWSPADAAQLRVELVGVGPDVGTARAVGDGQGHRNVGAGVHAVWRNERMMHAHAGLQIKGLRLGFE